MSNFLLQIFLLLFFSFLTLSESNNFITKHISFNKIKFKNYIKLFQYKTSNLLSPYFSKSKLHYESILNTQKENQLIAINELKNYINRLEHKIHQLETTSLGLIQNEDLKNEDSQINKVKELEENIELMQNESQNLYQEIETLEQLNSEKDENIKKIQEKLDNLNTLYKNEKEKYENEINNLKGQLLMKDKTIASLKEDISKLNVDLKTRVAEINSYASKEIQYVNTIEELKNKLKVSQPLSETKLNIASQNTKDLKGKDTSKIEPNLTKEEDSSIPSNSIKKKTTKIENIKHEQKKKLTLIEAKNKEQKVKGSTQKKKTVPKIPYKKPVKKNSQY